VNVKIVTPACRLTRTYFNSVAKIAPRFQQICQPARPGASSPCSCWGSFMDRR
jgi:hypothetical protein